MPHHAATLAAIVENYRMHANPRALCHDSCTLAHGIQPDKDAHSHSHSVLHVAMNAFASISNDLAAKVSALKIAGEELRQATTTDTKLDAILKFGTELDAVHNFEQEQLQVWPRISSFRLWEGLIDVLIEAPKLTDRRQHVESRKLKFSLMK